MKNKLLLFIFVLPIFTYSSDYWDKMISDMEKQLVKYANDPSVCKATIEVLNDLRGFKAAGVSGVSSSPLVKSGVVSHPPL